MHRAASRRSAREELRSYYEENYIKMAVQTFSFPEEPEIPEGATEEDKASYEEFYKTERGNVYTNANSFYLQAQIAWMQDRAGMRCSTPTNSRMQRLPVRSTT